MAMVVKKKEADTGRSVVKKRKKKVKPRVLPKKGELLLKRGFEDGVMLVAPGANAHLGISFHNAENKEQLLSEFGPEGFVEGLKTEHQNFKELVEGHLGFPVEEIPLPENAPPDSYYVCDSGRVVNGNLFVPYMGAKTRRSEPGSLLEILKPRAKKVFRSPVGAKLEGGDVIQVEIGGKVAVILGKRNRNSEPKGLEVRTNSEGRKAFTSVMKEIYGDAFIGTVVAQTTCLHLGTAMEIIQAGPGEKVWITHNRWLVNPQKLVSDLHECFKVKKGTFASLRVPYEETWGAPVLANGNKVIVQEGFPLLKMWLESRGFDVKTLLSSFHQATDGNFECKIQSIL